MTCLPGLQCRKKAMRRLLQVRLLSLLPHHLHLFLSLLAPPVNLPVNCFLPLLSVCLTPVIC
jgi:hypothetical protein